MSMESTNAAASAPNGTDRRRTAPRPLRGIALALALAATAPAPHARGDVIHLQTGYALEGIVTRESDDRVELRTSGGRLSLPRSEIVSIERADGTGNLLLEADFALRREDALAAEQHLADALRAGLDTESARAWCTRNQPWLAKALLRNLPGAHAIWTRQVRELGGLPPESDGPRGDVYLVESLPPSTATLLTSGTFVPPPPREPGADLPPGGEPRPDDVSPLARLHAAAVAGARNRAPTPPDLADYFVAMARTMDAIERKDLAFQLLCELDLESLARAGRTREFVQPLLIDRLKDALTRQDFEKASAIVARVEAARLPASEGCRAIYVMRWAAMENRLGHYREALRVLRENLSPLFPEVAGQLMRTTLLDARNRLVRAGRHDQAIQLLEDWAEHAGLEKPDDLLASLYRDWGDRLLDDDRAGAARMAYEQYLRLSPEASAQVLDLCEFHERWNAMGDSDYGSAFELAQWAADRGLVTEAVEAYEMAAGDPRLEAMAREQIGLQRDRIALRHLDACMQWFEMGEPQRALDELEKMGFLPANPKVRQEVDRLHKACWNEITRRGKLRPYQAEALWQDAQRRFLMGKTDEAIADMERILVEYHDTPVVDDVRRFLNRARSYARLRQLGAAGSPTGPDTVLPPETGSGIQEEVREILEGIDEAGPADMEDTAPDGATTHTAHTAPDGATTRTAPRDTPKTPAPAPRLPQ